MASLTPLSCSANSPVPNTNDISIDVICQEWLEDVHKTLGLPLEEIRDSSLDETNAHIFMRDSSVDYLFDVDDDDFMFDDLSKGETVSPAAFDDDETPSNTELCVNVEGGRERKSRKDKTNNAINIPIIKEPSITATIGESNDKPDEDNESTQNYRIKSRPLCLAGEDKHSPSSCPQPRCLNFHCNSKFDPCYSTY